ncbi:MAG: hypothetical protein V8T36_09840 [Ruthenibacterium lactatiformans]
MEAIKAKQEDLQKAFYARARRSTSAAPPSSRPQGGAGDMGGQPGDDGVVDGDDNVVDADNKEVCASPPAGARKADRAVQRLFGGRGAAFGPPVTMGCAGAAACRERRKSGGRCPASLRQVIFIGR